MRRLLALLLCAAAVPAALAQSRVAVAAAANFVYALEALHAELKRAEPELTVVTTVGASGNLFAQIKNGAPFDVFVSADTDFPQQLVAEQQAAAETLRIFAAGRLVVWTTRPGLDPADWIAAVRSPQVKKIAIAQPKTAPYGRAAAAVLDQAGLRTVAEPKLVIGENITQTAQFVETGGADLGFVALSLVRSPRLAGRGRWSEVPERLYAAVPLDHAAVLTTRGAANPAARRYLDFLRSEPARKILLDFGYRLPAPPAPARPRSAHRRGPAK